MPNSSANSLAARYSKLHCLGSRLDYLLSFKLNSNSDCYLNMSYCFVIIVTMNWPVIAGTYFKGAWEHSSSQKCSSILMLPLDSSLSSAKGSSSCYLSIFEN